MFVLDLLYNLSLLVALTTMIGLFKWTDQLSSRWKPVLYGVLFGCVALIGMMKPFVLVEGVYFDGRTMLLGLCGLFYGPVAVAVSAVICLIYRLPIGGNGIPLAILTIASSSLIGLFFYYFNKKKEIRPHSLQIFLMGILVHLFMLLFIYVLPGLDQLKAIQSVGLTIIIAYPLATWFVGLILVSQESHKLILNSLKASEENYRLLVENQSDLVVKADENGCFLYVSNRYCKQFGKTEKQLIGTRFIESIHPDDQNATTEALRLLKDAPYSSYFEHRALTVDGWRWMGWAINAMLDNHGNVETFVGIGRDIHQRKEAEIRLSQMQARYQNLVETSPEAIFVILEKQIILANHSCVNLFGYHSNAEIIGLNIVELFHPEDRSLVLERIQYLIAEGGQVTANDERIIKKDGTIIPVEVIASPFLVDGKYGIHVIMRDIRDQIEAQGIIMSQKQRLEKAEEMAKLGSWEFDIATHQGWWSKQMYRFFAVDTSSDIPDLNDFRRFFHAEDQELVDQVFKQMTSGKMPDILELRSNPELGPIRFFRSTFKIEFDKKQVPVKFSGTLLDISDQKLIERALLKSEEELSITLMSIGDAVIATDIKGRITRMNVVAQNLTGWRLNEAIGQKLTQVFRIVDASTREALPDPVQTVLTTLDVVILKSNTLLLNKKGFEYHIADSAAPIRDRQGKIRGVILVFSDVTDKHKSQELLTRERILLRRVIDSLPFSLYIKDKEYRKVLVNQTEVDYLKKPLDEIIGKTDFDLFKKEYAEQYFIDDQIVIEKGISVLNRKERLPFDGQKDRWLSTTKIPWRDMNGKILGLIGFGMDITDQIVSEEKIKVLSQGIEQSPVAVIITDVDGHIEYVNPRFEQMTGYALNEVSGKMARIIRATLSDREFSNEIWNGIHTSNKWTGDFQSKKKNGESYWESVSISAIINTEGIITNLILIVEDITDRKKMLQDLVEARLKAEESDRLKSAFLANMSHEIRTPMNGILGFADLLKTPHLTGDEQSMYIEVIEKSGQRMLNIINDIIDISKIEAGQIDIFMNATNINDIIDYLFSFFHSEAEKAGINLFYSKPLTNEQTNIITDQNRLTQVLSNLIKNAMKFTPQGSISFGYELKGDYLQFYVKDTGIGIEPELIQKVFERFTQGSLMLSKRYEGAGLGLSISQAFIEKMGGTIWVESEVGKGSTFYFTIPYQICK